MALVRRDLAGLLWRPRTLLVLAYLAAASWTAVQAPVVSEGLALRELGAALTDAIPAAFDSGWQLVAVQALPLVVLAAALVVEDREAGGTWMTIHRAGGIPRWWAAKALAALALTALLVVVSALLVLGAAALRGWEVTLAVSEYASAPEGLGYGRIEGTSPLGQSVLVTALRVAALTPIALLALAIGAAVRRPALAYVLPIVLLLVYWRVGFSELPEALGLRVDLLRQAFWDHHGAGFEISWWWTPPVIAVWTLAAALCGRLVVRRSEVTQA